MKVRTLALLGLFEWTSGCTTQANSIHNDTTTDTGGSQSASGGQDALGGAATGGNANVGGTSFLDEGTVILGACMAPDESICRDYSGVPGFEPTFDSAREHCFNRYDDTWSESMWREGEHCPLNGASHVCKNGEIVYYYGELLPRAEPDEACDIGWQLIYWNE